MTDALSLKQMNGEEHIIHFKIFSVIFIRLGWAWFYHWLPRCLAKCRAHSLSVFVERLT